MNLGQRKGLILSLSPTEKGAGDLQLHVGSLCSLIPTLLPVSCFRRCVDLAHGNGFLLWLTPLDPRSQTTLGSAITRTRPAGQPQEPLSTLAVQVSENCGAI